jgi:hypothetical protein
MSAIAATLLHGRRGWRREERAQGHERRDFGGIGQGEVATAAGLGGGFEMIAHSAR